MTLSAADRRIRSLRPARPAVDAWTAHGTIIEDERSAGGTERALTVFLAGAECPFTCSFCDLWRWTIDGPTPPGALPAQLGRVLSSLDASRADRIKLYNASNFFDPRAVPAADVPAIADLLRGFPAATVESHASTIGSRTTEFARRFTGRLEVAVGLETIHPVAMKNLNKRLDLKRFDRAAQFLADHDIDLRVFVLLGTPHVAPEESVEWTVRTVEYAARRNARMISVIPVRAGNGEIDRLERLGHFVAPTLRQLERALERCLAYAPTVVTADLWDVDRLPACAACRPTRLERLRRANLTGQIDRAISCDVCGS